MTESSYEREKKERRRLRARQRHLKARFLHDMRALIRPKLYT